MLAKKNITKHLPAPFQHILGMEYFNKQAFFTLAHKIWKIELISNIDLKISLRNFGHTHKQLISKCKLHTKSKKIYLQKLK